MADLIERVQEIALKNNGSPTKRFIRNESDRPNLESPLGRIPIIDLSYVKSKDFDQRQVEDSKLKSASQNNSTNDSMTIISESTEISSSVPQTMRVESDIQSNTRSVARQQRDIFGVIGHGIPTSLIDEVRNVQRLFFKLPPKEKQNYTSDSKIYEFKEGYGSDPLLSDEQILDWNDMLYLNVYPEEGRKIDLCPQKPESFKEKMFEFNEKVMIIMDEIFKAVARSLGLDEFYFVNNGTKGLITWRFNYYPLCSKPDLVLGLKPHSDSSSITILLQDDQVPGLEVFNDEFGWVKVPIRPDALVVILGDEIQIMTNGKYKSALHKVVTNSERERISLSMFVLSNPQNVLGPIDELIEEGKPKLYKTTTVKNYQDSFLANFAIGKHSIDAMRV
ncbi:2-oxoglutarate (2OG) and Fe(II)-dependent oxygenase-like protein [Zostera marina]|uniref:2-oxoglutarate (2OG) and Fe(II)-dependent oxygenase-like protein n=1 Tax=Zostera marina TaxID=29655 RepID=A0A0K9P9V9_ZOSMR|nr:2-oxoglutarate (2OG) and Fe(II)-dependent oxygenase-like protein [Zostera marina]